ncbi:sigma-54 dependent transcriptional regulator [Thalassotalea fonticola]|uniref:Sigma-54 dependent transcriptional regulator n=1 Tax=Thalassotalea fonticola TaxID=3065649 RepID=A0ABZ0GRI4_9GAMM|nr:sigma-54 dependent transcriptional regulator [Colwelliaceae bacterium S1-1]
MMNKKILVVDDEINICRSIKACLQPEGYTVTSCLQADKAFSCLLDEFFDVAIIDIRLGKSSGIELFKQMLSENIATPVIFISGNASLNEAAQTLKLGAYDFIEKPFNVDKLLVTIKNCLDFQKLKTRVSNLEGAQQSELLGEHPLMDKLRLEISKVAKSDVAVLISGESGTGKELIAKQVHQQSKRSDHALVTVNCSAIPNDLIDSALFGHVKGAFTGADKHKKGFFETADKGTLFLDEIADMPLSSQSSLLRVLESNELQKVGSDKITKVDVRLLAASHKDLKAQIEQGLFREDLFYRINVIPIKSPSLRERSSDISLLVEHFIDIICQRNGMAIKTIDDNCNDILSQYAWPGNVRELLNAVERMIIMGGEHLTQIDIPEEIQNSKLKLALDDEQLSLKEFKQLMEREYLLKKIEQYNGNITEVAKSLMIDRTHLHKKLTQHGIKRHQSFD